MELKNIIFDLGGVIIDLDYQKTTQAFIDLGVTDFDAIYSKAKQSDIFDNFEKGIIDAKEFRAFIRSKINMHLEDSQIDKAWNAMLINFPASRVEWLKNVSKRYRIFLLSNTNQIHIVSFKGIADNLFGKDVFLLIFEKVYLSSEIGMRKPDANIFEKEDKNTSLKIADPAYLVSASTSEKDVWKKYETDAPLICNVVYPQVLGVFDINTKEKNEVSCEYAKQCGVSWSSLKCK